MGVKNSKNKNFINLNLILQRMDYLLLFLIFIGAAFILPELAKKIHIPYVTSIILTGIIIGPFGFKIVDLGEIASFLAFIGAIFLMFTAGLDVKLSSLRRIGKKTVIIALFNGIVPFIVGFYLGQFFNYDLTTSLILGAIFVSSSIAIIIPTMKEIKLAETDLGKTIISSTVFVDISSLLILAFLLKSLSPGEIALPLYIPLVIISLLLLFFLLPKLQKYFVRERTETQKEDVFEGELRFIVIVLVVTAILFEFLGLHAIIAGFFVGLFLSDAIKHRLVSEKLYTISYGIFIPIFFLVIGMRTDILSLVTIQEHLVVTLAIIGSLIGSKFVSGWVGSRLAGNSNYQSLIVAAATVPQLSTTLVVALAASQVGLFDEVLVSSIVVLSIVTTLISPFIVKLFHRKLENRNKNIQLKNGKKFRGVKKEVKQLKQKEKRIKLKQKVVKKSKEKGQKEKEDIQKHKKEIKKIKKIIRKKKKKKKL